MAFAKRSSGGGPRRTSAAAARTGPGPKRKRAIKRKRAAVEKTPEQKAAAEEARVLSGKAARYLRGLGHHLDPVVQIGKEGITTGVVNATREALTAHELIKVRVLAESPIDRKEAGTELAKLTGGSLAQTLGRTLLLYKRHPNKPTIELPR